MLLMNQRREATRHVGSFARILPYLWPYRRAIVMSAFCAIAISFFWAANLSATWPIMKLLFKGQSIHDVVDAEIKATQKQIDNQQADVQADHDISDSNQALRVGKRFGRGSDSSYYLAMLLSVREHVLPWLPSNPFRTLVFIFTALVAGTLIKSLFVYWEDTLVGDAINRALVDIRKTCFRHALNIDYQTISKSGTSDLTSRLANDIEVLGAGLAALLIRLIREPLKAGGCVLAAFLVEWRLALLAVIALPCMGLTLNYFGGRLKRASHGTLESISRISKCSVESFDNIKAVIGFGSGRRQRRQFHHANKFYFKKQSRVLRLASIMRQSTELMGVIAVTIAVFPGAYLVLNHTDKFMGLKLSSGPMDSEQLTMLYAFLLGTLDSIRKMSSVNREMKRGAAACERILQLLDMPTRVPEPAVPLLLPRHSDSIEFSGVTFHYATANEADHRPPALVDVNLKVKQGEVVAVLGGNGSGKSTLLNLLPRFYDPEQGCVRIDGVDLRDVSSRDLRAQIGIVTQETLLFDDTIAANIRLGKPSATDAEVEEAARRAHVLPFVSQLPEGFQTQVGERGMKLSGGQRQRIALARAIIRDPSILILDEATSAIDGQTEQVIHQVLMSFVKGRTVFVISHVLNETFLDLVTRIVVMENGRVAATGTHAELLATCPAYSRLYQASGQRRAA